MNKLALATTIAAISSQAIATNYNLGSDITDAQLYLGTADKLSEAGGSFRDFNLSGKMTDIDNDGVPESVDITFNGQAIFVAGPTVRLTFDLTSDSYTAGSGVLMNGGTILIETDTGSGYTVYSTVDASVTNLPFFAGLDGHLAPAPTQTTAGLQLEGFTSGCGSAVEVECIDLPGEWNGVFLDPSWNNAISAVSLFGNTAGLFVEGTVTRVPVPVPAAAWLFGSSLLWLAAAGRSKRRRG